MVKDITIEYAHKKVMFLTGALKRLEEEDAIENVIRCHRTFYEIQVLRYIRDLNVAGNYADVGANIGNHSIFFALFCPSHTVYSFEPVKDIFDKLKKNLEVNGIENCEAHNVALSDNTGKGKFTTPDAHNSGNSRLSSDGTVDSRTGVEAPEVDIITLDSLNLDIKVLKIDVEEMELHVLGGAMNTLKNVEHIFIEMRDVDDPTVNANNKEIESFLKKNQFRFAKQLANQVRHFERNHGR